VLDCRPGCGFVVYASQESADAALAAVADQVRLPGAARELIVRYAGPRPEETGQCTAGDECRGREKYGEWPVH